MKKIYKIIAIGIIGLMLLLAGCAKDDKQNIFFTNYKMIFDEFATFDDANKDVANVLNYLNYHDEEKLISLFSEDIRAHTDLRDGVKYLIDTWGDTILTYESVGYMDYSFENLAVIYPKAYVCLEHEISVTIKNQKYTLVITTIPFYEKAPTKTGIYAIGLKKDDESFVTPFRDYFDYKRLGVYLPNGAK